VTTTPMKFANTVAYKHYQLMLSGRGLLALSTTATACSLRKSRLLSDVFVATAPNPANSATGVVMPLLQWVPGDTAAFVDIYVGTTPDLAAADKWMRCRPSPR